MPVDLLSPITLGPYELANRMVLAPMTRTRAIDTVPTPLMAEYYAQRASAGLLLTDCTMVSPLSYAYINNPGIYSDAQVAGWRLVTEAVHAKGGRIFLQLWHCGRTTHASLLGGKAPVAPSAIAAPGEAHTFEGKQPFSTPRALETDEIPGIVAEFRTGAENAMAAGFDGVELHGAFGYLIDQFLQDGSNQRTDQYGGSIENRARFALDVVQAVVDVWGGQRVGIKLSPSNHMQGMHDSNPQATFRYLGEKLARFGLAYVHLMEPLSYGPPGSGPKPPIEQVSSFFRSFYRGTIMANANYTKESGNAVLASGDADLVAFGRLFLANPDLPRRFAVDAPLNAPDMRTFYGVGTEGLERGYTDYPFLTEPA